MVCTSSKVTHLHILQDLGGQIDDSLTTIGIHRQTDETSGGLVGGELPTHTHHASGGLVVGDNTGRRSDRTGEHDHKLDN